MLSSPRDTIPADVVLDVMARLPVKSVMRLRLVSKSFFSDAAAPKFISSHLALSRSSRYVGVPPTWHGDPLPYSIAILDKSFFEVLRPEIPFLSSSIFDPECGVKSFNDFVGSFHGLLCYTSYWTSYYGRPMVLWNPMIGKFKSIGDTSLNSNMLHDETTKVELGLGFDGKSNDHKIIRIVIPKHENELSPQGEIYSLRINSWRPLIFPINSVGKILSFESKYSVFHRGAVHWLACVSGGTNSPEAHDMVILCFKIDVEQFKVIRLPQDYARGAEPEGFSVDLMVVKGLLAFAIYYSVMEDGVMENKGRVWKMEKYADVGSWTEQIITISHVSRIYGWTEDGELIMRKGGCPICLYNLETGTLKETNMAPVDSVVFFRESLVLL